METSDTESPDFNATAVLYFHRQERVVKLKLEGTILGKQVKALRDFLKNVMEIPGNKWTLQLDHVNEISLEGLRVLARFAKEIQRRGHELVVTNIQPELLATFRELNLRENFSWKV